MSKHRIFTLGFELPGDEFEYIEFTSDATLLDADIVLVEPTMGGMFGREEFEGLRLFDDATSFRIKRHLDHWRSELAAARDAGKLVIVYLKKPIECYRYTGEKQYSGTGRSRATTNIVAKVNSYDAIPGVKGARPKTGTGIVLAQDATYLAPYWKEFGAMSPYEAEITGDFSRVLLKTSSGDRIIGSATHSASSAMIYLPPIRLDQTKFVRTDKKSGKSFWTPEATRFGKRLVANLVNLADSLKQSHAASPPPAWVGDFKYRLAEETKCRDEAEEIDKKIANLVEKKRKLEDQIGKSRSLGRLLYEQGKPLERSILEALAHLGFHAAPFADSESEFDCVLSCPEGRCLGEAEGKDNRAINIDKFSQLERNLQEDFAKEDVTEFAKGILFGNAYRLTPVEERADFFTAKCVSAAKRVNVALVRTPDLFQAARYMKEHSENTEYARACRLAIFDAKGDVVAFPALPSS